MEITKPCLVNIVYVGDSVTYGQFVDPKLRWTSLLADRIAESHMDTPIHVFSLNRSGPGDTTRMGLEKFPADVQRSNPHVLFIDYGMNDCNCWLTDQGLPRVSEDAFRANLIEMITRGLRFGAIRVILATKTRSLKRKMMLSGVRYEEANARYSEIIRDVAATRPVTLFDVRKQFDPLDVNALEKLLLPYPDHIHLSPAGHEFYAEAALPVIDDAINAAVREKVRRGDLP